MPTAGRRMSRRRKNKKNQKESREKSEGTAQGLFPFLFLFKVVSLGNKRARRQGKDDTRNMEIRLLYRNELQWAVYTANEAFEILVRPYASGQEEVEAYYRYMRVENLWQEMNAGHLFLWGAFENGQMCGVSALQDVGHITMLYVRPQYGRRHVGTQLVNHMCQFAASVLHRERVTIHVTPVAAASYFYHIGFTLIQGCPFQESYVPLERGIWTVPQGYRNVQIPGTADGSLPYGAMGANSTYRVLAPQRPKKPEVTYPTKKVSAKCILGLAAGVLLFSFLVFTGVTVHYIVKDGGTTESTEEKGQKNPDGVNWEVPEDLGGENRYT